MYFSHQRIFFLKIVEVHKASFLKCIQRNEKVFTEKEIIVRQGHKLLIIAAGESFNDRL